MKVLCINESSSYNLGDRAINMGLTSLLNNHSISYDSHPFSSLPHSKKEYHQIDVTSTKDKFKSFLTSMHSVYMVLHITRIIFFSILNMRTLCKKMREVDYVIIGGGSLLINNNYSFPLSSFFIFLCCKITKCKFGIAGVSTRSSQDIFSKFLFGCLLSNSEFVYVRDHISKKLIKEYWGLDAKFLPDFAMYIGKLESKVTKYDIAINVMGPQKHGFFSNDKNCEKYRALITKIISDYRDLNIVLYTTGDLSDYVDVKYYLDYWNKLDLSLHALIPNTVQDILNLYSESGFVIATRLHGAIIALSQEKKVNCFNWDSKVEGFFESMDLKDSLFDFDHPLSMTTYSVKKEMREIYSNFIKEEFKK